MTVGAALAIWGWFLVVAVFVTFTTGVVAPLLAAVVLAAPILTWIAVARRRGRR